MSDSLSPRGQAALDQLVALLKQWPFKSFSPNPFVAEGERTAFISLAQKQGIRLKFDNGVLVVWFNPWSDSVKAEFDKVLMARLQEELDAHPLVRECSLMFEASEVRLMLNIPTTVSDLSITRTLAENVLAEASRRLVMTGVHFRFQKGYRSAGSVIATRT